MLDCRTLRCACELRVYTVIHVRDIRELSATSLNNFALHINPKTSERERERESKSSLIGGSANNREFCSFSLALRGLKVGIFLSCLWLASCILNGNACRGLREGETRVLFHPLSISVLSPTTFGSFVFFQPVVSAGWAMRAQNFNYLRKISIDLWREIERPAMKREWKAEIQTARRQDARNRAGGRATAGKEGT